MAERPDQFVSRAGLKLDHALREFGLDVAGLVCADFGCNVGGFTDCLLRRDATKVFAIDTGYGALAWTLRNDPRVVVMERTNALHVQPPLEEPVRLVVMDMGWTPQRLCVPAGLKWLRGRGRIVSLVKPHYEVEAAEKHLLKRGVLEEHESERIFQRVLEQFETWGARALNSTRSPLLGGAGKGRVHGNAEYLVLLEPIRTE